MTQISALLGKAELAALLDMATADCRRLREQMRYLLREEAKRRGLLPAEPPPLAALPLTAVEVNHGTAG